MFTFGVFTIIAIILGLFYLRAKIEGKITLSEIKEMDPDWKNHRPKMTIIADRIIKYTGKIINILLFPLIIIFRYPELQPYKQQKEIDRWLDVKRVAGGLIIYIMATGNVLVSLFFFAWIASYGQIIFALIWVLLHIALSIALIYGWNWTRVLLGLGAVLYGLVSLDSAVSYTGTGDAWRGFLWTMASVGLVGGVLLLYSKSVKYYIYYRRERIHKS